MVVTGPIGERGWAALAEALRLLPPLVPQDPQAPQDLQDFDDPEMLNNQEFYHQGFRSFVVSSTGQGPRKLMLDGRQEDLKAVFNSIPIGSFWHLEYDSFPISYLEYGTQIIYQRSLLKASEEDWVRLKQYMDNKWRAIDETLVLYSSMSMSMKMRTCFSLGFKLALADSVARALLSYFFDLFLPNPLGIRELHSYFSGAE